MLINLCAVKFHSNFVGERQFYSEARLAAWRCLVYLVSATTPWYLSLNLMRLMEPICWMSTTLCRGDASKSAGNLIHVWRHWQHISVCHHGIVGLICLCTKLFPPIQIQIHSFISNLLLELESRYHSTEIQDNVSMCNGCCTPNPTRQEFRNTLVDALLVSIY